MKKTAIITGAAGNGIGRSTALTLARDGFNVVINYRSNKKKAEELTEIINNNGGTAVPIKADIFIHSECELLINETIFNYNRIDCCVIGPGAEWNPEPIDKLNVSKSLNDVVHEISPIYSLIPQLIPEMKKQKGGRIVAIASNPKLPSPSFSYNTAKNSRIAAMLGLVNFCWKNKITVNVLAPGPIQQIENQLDAIEQIQEFPKSTMSISPQDIAEMISFICSDKGRYLTGNVIEYQF